MHICNNHTVRYVCGAPLIRIVPSRAAVAVPLNDTGDCLWKTLPPAESSAAECAAALSGKTNDACHATVLAGSEACIYDWQKTEIVLE